MPQPAPADGSASADLRRVAERLEARFQHMARRDGGVLAVVAVEASTIRFEYRPGIDPACDTGACVLPGSELRSLIGETLHRSHPDVELVVDVIAEAAR